MDFKVYLSPRARRDLVEIWTYIAKDSPETASSFCGQLSREALSLRTFPDRGHSLRNRKNVRRIPYSSYLIYFKIDEQNRTVDVLRFRHSARSQHRLRLKEESPEYSASPTEIEMKRLQLASGEGAVIPGDEALLQQAQSQQ